ncbi:MAG: histidine phosphatase family protein [Limnothrix sp.]
MRSIWLVRHGNRLDFVQPQWFNEAVRRYDPPLCPLGDRQAQELGLRLRGEPIDHIFVSPFVRALQTAQHVAESLGLPLRVESGLGEWHNSDWMTAAPITHPWADCLKDFPQIDPDYLSVASPVYPENRAQMLERAAQTILAISRQYSGNLLFVGHKDPLSGCFAALLEGREASPVFEVCAVTQLVLSGDRWQCTVRNETSHLSQPGIRVAPKHLC